MDDMHNNPKETNASLEVVKEDVKQRVSGLFESIRVFLVSLVSIRDEIDFEGAPKRIEDGIKFQGFNVWVLIFSIFIASIGLNSNSNAIIIGAMLISPLMGPILGVGFSLGTNRFDLLKRSALNFVIMMLVGLITSWLYFLLTPLDKADTEILARTSPTILDVLVAIFGGLAGAIAGMRKSNTLTVIPGVAIATALMPPLCTVGYGIATWQPEFAFGAMYLFLLNSLIISVATTIFVRFARFPLHTFVNKRKERKAKQLITLFMILLIGPSIWFFITATQKSIFETNANNFVDEVVRQPNSFLITKNIAYQTDSIPKIEVLIGGKTISTATISEWKEQLNTYNISNTEFIVIQDVHDEMLSETIEELKQNSTSQSEQNKTVLNAVMAERVNDNNYKDSVITALEHEIQFRDSMEMEYRQISAELHSMYSGIDRLAFGKIVEEAEGKLDTIPTMFINWSRKVGTSTRNARLKKIRAWLPVRVKSDKISVKQYIP